MSTIRADVVQNATGGATTLTDLYPAKAWAVYDQYTTQTLLDSSAVSSIADLGVGKTRVTFSNPFSSANYCVAGTLGGGGSQNAGGGAICFDMSPATVPTTTHSDVDSFIAANGNRDFNYNSVIFTA